MLECATARGLDQATDETLDRCPMTANNTNIRPRVVTVRRLNNIVRKKTEKEPLVAMEGLRSLLGIAQ